VIIARKDRTMPVIIVAADVYSEGREIAEQTAAGLGYRYLDREVIGEISRIWDVPEKYLLKVLDESAPLGGVFGKRLKRHRAIIQREVLRVLLQDNVVCHGLCAHLYVLGVSHVIRVRLLSLPPSTGPDNREDEAEMDCIAEAGSGYQKCCRYWSLKDAESDQQDTGRYDLVIRTKGVPASDSVQLLTEAVEDPKLRANTYALNCLKDLELAARVRARLLETFANVNVEVNAATVVVKTRLSKRSRNRKIETIKRMVGDISGVSYVEVHALNGLLSKALP
jgi:hypothetical protein